MKGILTPNLDFMCKVLLYDKRVIWSFAETMSLELVIPSHSLRGPMLGFCGVFFSAGVVHLVLYWWGGSYLSLSIISLLQWYFYYCGVFRWLCHFCNNLVSSKPCLKAMTPIRFLILYLVCFTNYRLRKV